jgi:predicted MFS family arabinose efflux permease
LRPGVRRGALGLLLAGSLGISTGYGMLLLLPLYVRQLGGDEADFGLIMATAAVPAAVGIGLLVRFPDRIRPHLLLGGSIAVYGLGAVGVAATGSLLLAGLGLVLGVGLHNAGASLPTVFVAGAILAGLGAASIVVLHARLPRREAEPDLPEQLPLGRALRRIARSAAARPLLLVLLSACLFTTLTSFQTTYADVRHLSPDVFYLSYTVAVLLARFGLSRALADRDPSQVAAVSTTVLCGSVASFLLVGSNPVIYGLASAGVGIGYGLSLPILQAQAVARSSHDVRPRVLPLGGLLFETAVLAFPALAGTVITGLGYQAVFAVLFAFAVVQTVVAWGLPDRSAAPVLRPGETV